MKDVSIPVPAQIGPYKVIRPLAQGGMAAVFEVQEPGTHEHLALKLLTHRGVAMPRFAREFRALTRLDHPNIVRVYRYGAWEGNPYLTMELLHGVPVQVHAKSVGKPGDPQRTREVVRIISAVADALDYLHSRGIIHRDLKSANILVLHDARVKLLDFGTASLVAEPDPITRDGEFVGTFAYASPEQITGGVVDHRSDLYSLGALFYRLATGKRLFEASSPHELARMHVEGRPIPPRALVPALPEELEAIILRLVAKDPLERPQSARGLLDLLRGRQESPADERVVISKPTRLVGREAELESLRAALQKARPARMVLVLGPPGSGRGRLLKAAVAEARGLGWRVFAGNFTDTAGLGALSDVVEQCWSTLPRERRQELQDPLLGMHRADALLQRPEDESTQPPPPPELHRGMAAILAARAALDQTPLVVGLSALQRASPAALDALAGMRQALRQEGATVLFLASASDESDAPGAVLRQLLPDAWRLHLQPLSVAGVAELVRTMLGGSIPSPDLARNIHAATGGLPGYVEEILRAMVQTGALQPHRTGASITWVDRSEGRIAPPASARDALALRLEGVPRPARRALEALAVAGGEAPTRLLAWALEQDPDPCTELLEDLASRRLVEIREVGGRELWAFRLGMTRGVVLDRLRPSRRQVLRRRLAQAAQDEPLGASRVELLAAVRDPRALTDVLAWAEPLVEAGRVHEALPALEVVQGLLDAAEGDPATAARVLILRGRALAEARPGDARAEASYREAADRAPDTVLRGEACLYHAQLLLGRGELDRGRALLNQAYEALARGASPRLKARVCREVGVVQWLSGRLEAADRWFDEALHAARQDGQPREVARALVSRGVSQLARGGLGEAERSLREAVALHEAAADRFGQWFAQANLAEVYRMRGRFSDAVRVLEPELRAARELGTLSRFALLSLNLAETEIELYRLGLARERLAVLTAELDPREHLHLCVGIALAQGRLAMISGEATRAVDILAPALARSREAGLVGVAGRVQAWLGEALVHAGQAQAGLEHLDAALAALTREGQVPALAEACACRGRALLGQEDPEQSFAPVRAWMDREPALLVRVEYLSGSAVWAAARGWPDRSLAFWQAAAEVLREIREGLSSADQEALNVHPWTTAVRRGLGA